MRRLIITGITLLGVTLGQSALATTSWWEVQAVDTMKISRDLAQEKLHDASFDRVINQHMQQIADTGATHVSIGTPYDERFLPILTRWVSSARQHNLKVWFRGNWSGWEGWFNTPRIGREEHVRKTNAFIRANQDLFEDGDIFTSCPECENGGPGDPRNTGDVAGYRQFLIREYVTMNDAFATIGKRVTTNYFSMNGDVARLIMDRPTTSALGGVVTIDHYVGTPKQLADDIRQIAATSGGKVVLGEFGAPVPDIHGALTPDRQAAWLAEALQHLSGIPEVVGLNYWVNYGGTTALWNDNGQARPGVATLTKYFTPAMVVGQVIDEDGKAIPGAVVRLEGGKETVSDKEGNFAIPYIAAPHTLIVTAPSFIDVRQAISTPTTFHRVTLHPTAESWWETLPSKLAKLFFFWR